MNTAQNVTVLDKIRTRGHRLVVIRPARFRQLRVPLEDLFPIVAEKSVQLRGWDYPHVNHREGPIRGPDWVGREYDRHNAIEFWRFYTSGQFVHRFGMGDDWRDQSNDVQTADEDGIPRRNVWYFDTAYLFYEIFEFAARLAQSKAGDGWMHVEIAAKQLAGRHLVERGKLFQSWDLVAKADDWSDRWDGTMIDLMSIPRELAARSTRKFLAQFGLDISMETLRNLQGSIGR